MATTVPLQASDVDAALRDRGSSAYILTVSDDGSPHAVQVDIARAEAGGLTAAVGNTTASNARTRPHVSLLFPFRHAGDYSLIVNATASVEREAEGHRLRLTPIRAVLHRPGPPPDPAASSCGSDCVPLSIPIRAPR